MIHFEDTRRKLIELHLDSAKKRLSVHTEFVHLFYDALDDQNADTIPLLENMYYALALFRTRLSDPILEAKQLIERLLPFEVEGNFPIYLHQYPSCKDRCLSLHLLPVLHYLLTDYKQVLGDELTKKLQALSDRIVLRGKEIQQQKKLPFGADVKLAAFTRCLGPKEPSSSQEWGEYLLALHMIKEETWVGDEVRRAAAHWNEALGIYICGGKVHPQEGFLPKPTVFDLFMAAQTGHFSKQVLSHPTLLLLASIVHAFELKNIPFASEAVSVITPLEGKQPLVLFWREGQELRSLAIEHSGASCHVTKTEGRILLQCTYPQEVPFDEDNSEIALHINASGKMSLLVNDVQASTFRLGQKTQIQTDGHQIDFSLCLIEGDGKFFGHVSKANRAYQTRKEGFEVFDWKIGLRTIQRSPNCSIRMEIVLSPSNQEALII